MSDVTVTQADEDLALRIWRVHPSEILAEGMTRPEWYAREIARYREAIAGLGAAQPNRSMCGGLYPVHGSVTHGRMVDCCDFCGLPADYEPALAAKEAELAADLIEAQRARIAELEATVREMAGV